MVRRVIGSIFHGVDPLSYFSFQPVLHDWCNKGRDMCYPVCGRDVAYKRTLAVISERVAHVSGPLPYVRRYITVNKMC